MIKSIFSFIISKISFNKIIPDANKVLEESQTIIIQDDVPESKWQRWFPFSFFYGNNKFQPIYFFCTVFSSLAIWALWIKIDFAYRNLKAGTFTPDMISTTDLSLLLTFIGSLILLYNTNKKINTSTNIIAPNIEDNQDKGN